MKRPIITTPQIRHLLAYRYSEVGESGGLIGVDSLAGRRRLAAHRCLPRGEEERMSRLLRMDRTGHTELAAWSPRDPGAYERAATIFDEQLAGGYMGVAKLADESWEQVKRLPVDVEYVLLRRPIVGG
jgi:hypothetical protein